MADNIDIRDGAGASVTVRTTEGAGPGYVNVPHHIVDSIVAALPAGANAIGKLAANSGVDIGDVDVTSLPALAAGTNTIGKLAANSGVDIGDVDVLSLPSLPAGANAIGKLAANSGVDIGDVDVTSVTLPTTVVHGKTTIGTASSGEAVLGSSTALLSGVTIKALSANTGLVYVGKTGMATSTGFELNAKESVFIEVDNIADIFIIVAVDAEGVTYVGS